MNTILLLILSIYYDYIKVINIKIPLDKEHILKNIRLNYPNIKINTIKGN